MLANILAVVDERDISIPVLLDLSAASDTVNHEDRLRRFRRTYGIGNGRSYPVGRTTSVDVCRSWLIDYLVGLTFSIIRLYKSICQAELLAKDG